LSEAPENELEAAIEEARGLEARCRDMARRLAQLARELDRFARTEHDENPIPDQDWPRRPQLMAPDDLSAAAREVEAAARAVLVQAGGWGQVLGDLVDERR
jgi:hypothetical protein